MPTTPRPPAAPRDTDDDRHPADSPAPRASGAVPTADPTAVPAAVPTADPGQRHPVPLTARTPDIDRAALASAGADVARLVSALLAGTSAGPGTTDDRTLAVVATGALAARLPALSGVDRAAAFDEPEDELLHAYADLLVTRAEARRARTSVGRDDVLAVAHVGAAAAALDAADDPALLLLTGVPVDTQLRAATLLLAQTADDGGGAPDRLVGEVRELFAAQG